MSFYRDHLFKALDRKMNGHAFVCRFDELVIFLNLIWLNLKLNSVLSDGE